MSVRFSIRPFDDKADTDWVQARLAEGWGGRHQARRGELVDVLEHGGVIAEEDGEPAGMLFWRPDGDATELALLWAFEPRRGIGTALVAELLRSVPGDIWAVTTNDNREAVAFYRRLGFQVREVRSGAVDEARRTLKPQIPVIGRSGLPVRDEIELVLTRSL